MALVVLLAIPMVSYAETGQECASNCSSQCNPLRSGPDWASCMENCLKGAMTNQQESPMSRLQRHCRKNPKAIHRSSLAKMKTIYHATSRSIWRWFFSGGARLDFRGRQRMIRGLSAILPRRHVPKPKCLSPGASSVEVKIERR